MKANWSKLLPLTRAIHTACLQGIIGMSVAVKNDVREHFSRNGKFQPSLPGQPPAIKRNQLRNSIQVDVAGVMSGRLRARVGSNLKYARIHERGGIIRPKSGKMLPVPINDAAKRLAQSKGTQSLRDMPFVTRRLPSGRVYLVGLFGKAFGSYYTDASGKRREVRRTDQPVFVLKRSVKMPARPYLAPAASRAKTNRQVPLAFARAATNSISTSQFSGIKFRVVKK